MHSITVQHIHTFSLPQMGRHHHLAVCLALSLLFENVGLLGI